MSYNYEQSGSLVVSASDERIALAYDEEGVVVENVSAVPGIEGRAFIPWDMWHAIKACIDTAGGAE